jgi:hypothetical protein
MLRKTGKTRVQEVFNERAGKFLVLLTCYLSITLKGMKIDDYWLKAYIQLMLIFLLIK